MSAYVDRDSLTPRELAVWSATFAAEWQIDFRGHEVGHGFEHLEVDPMHDPAVSGFGHAERACTVADLAVLDMRDWEANGA